LMEFIIRHPLIFETSVYDYRIHSLHSFPNYTRFRRPSRRPITSYYLQSTCHFGPLNSAWWFFSTFLRVVNRKIKIGETNPDFTTYTRNYTHIVVYLLIIFLILLNIWIKGMKMKIGVPQNPSIGITTFYEITTFYDWL
jgi:hypothetical protein